MSIASGSWAMVYLGVRPRGGFPRWHVLGRETFVLEDGWSRLATHDLLHDGGTP